MASYRIRVLMLGLVTCAISWWPCETYAQTISPEKIAAAQKLYDEAIEQIGQNNFIDACPKLEEAIRLVPEGVGAKLELAKCYEGAGRLASAWRAFKIAEAAATVAGQPERQVRAKEGADALVPRLSSLTILIPESVRSLSGFTLTRNGVLVDPTDWSTPIPVDGGTYRLEATAPGKIRWEKTIEVGPSEKRERVEVGMLEDVAKPPIVLPKPERPWQSPAGLVVGGFGLAGAVIGSVLGGMAISKYDDSNADNRCDAQHRCDQTGLDLRREALGLANGSTGFFVAGGVLLVGGIVLFATAPRAGAAAQSKAGWTTEIAFGPTDFLIRGRW